MMDFCTLFDSNYISKGIALYLSIERQTADFTLYVMAMDRECQVRLNAMKMPHVVVECIDDCMSPELSTARNNRSRAEFCWTCGSYVTHYFLISRKLPSLTYLDSDLMFFSSPQVIFDELENKNASIGLSPHFTPYCASGKYCVQYCYFRNDSDGLAALTWWKDECLKWCYSKIEDGKYADQLYLSRMPDLFHGVVDISNRGAGIANWNAYQYGFDDGCVVFENRRYPFVFFHYSGFNIAMSDDILVIKECFEVSPDIYKCFVIPYVELLRDVFENSLDRKVRSIEYVKNYSYAMGIIYKFDNMMLQFAWWHRFKALLISLKYKNRRSPYSEQ